MQGRQGAGREVKWNSSNEFVKIKCGLGRSTSIVLMCFRIAEARQQSISPNLNNCSTMPRDDVFIGAAEVAQQIRKIFGFHTGREAGRI
ncbi:hypothetical protein CQ14_21000 [Bradyrhizobium lablabi]|uniref:Uncharacterized protein n=1 Tax=Bradyrhizobium lablabi TaxID=722472 RepID=A0A0R3N1E2_9BRAD|nr:hypothetical protein CQ14_21000 [Bradyrhizobium lablabi]